MGKHRAAAIRTGAAIGAVAALVTALATPIVGTTAVSAAPGDGQVVVRVVQEVNANGLVDSTVLEPPLIGTTVTLTDADGLTTTALTDANGLATFTPASTVLTGGKYRVEVQNPRPTLFEPGFAANNQSAAAAPIVPADLKSPTNAKLSTSVEFVDVSDGTPAYVNQSFWYPGHYCQDNATLVTACQPWSAPHPQAPQLSAPTEKTLISAPYRFNADDVQLAENQQTGAVYGIAYDRVNDRIFSAAYAKRGSAYGPGGPGGIYVTDLSSGTAYPAAGSTSLWTQVPNPGADGHQLTVEQDYAFFDNVSRESLGDIDISLDGRYLFGVNMFTKSVFVYDLIDPDAVSYVGATVLPNPCATPSDWHPMGTGAGLDSEFVGGVCSGQSTGDRLDMSAHVYRFDAATGTVGAEVLNQALDYGRGRAYTQASCSGSLPDDLTVGAWFSWVDTWAAVAEPNPQRPVTGCKNPPPSQTVGYLAYPTPLLGDIEEETNGDLVITFRDRFTDQAGDFAREQNLDGTFVFTGQPVSGGDVVRGCRLIDGTFVLDPQLTPADTLAPGAVCTDNNATAVDNGGQARTYREFYVGDERYGSHQEAVFGGMALSRVENHLAAVGIDPLDAPSTQGILGVGRNGLHSAQPYGVRTDDNTSDRFAKGAGMADLEVLCDAAPLQIGSRLWLDHDKDGLQDPGETALAGVTVHLYNGAGALVGTAVTSANGEYFFDNSNVTGGLLPDTDYTVRIDNPADYAAGGPLFGYEPTLPNIGTDDELDSDGVAAPDGYPEASLSTGGAGQNDHSWDFGFTVPSVGVGNYVWVDENRDGLQTPGEPGIPGVVLVLTGPNGGQVTDVFGNPVGPVTTDANGAYTFDNLPVLPAGESYTVTIDQALSAPALAPYVPTLPGDGTNPLDSSTGSASSGDLTENGDRDDTLDFGFVTPSVGVGNYVWVDENRDGLQTPGEPGIPGVVLVLTDPDGNPVTDVFGNPVGTVTTDANGGYTFDNLPVLPAGESYTVTIDQALSTPALAPYVPTTPGDGTNPLDSSTGSASSGDLTENGDRDDTLDFGFVTPPSVSVGDYVWVDENRDVLQTLGEPGIPGVVLVLTGPNGGQVTDVFGNPVLPVTTDANGLYTFDDLPLLPAGQSYTVSIDQVASAPALVPYVPTIAGDGSSPLDSSTWIATSGDLTQDGDRDPTLDFGFVTPSVGVGNYVWVDENRDGLQTPGEPGIPGVVLVLTGPNGGSVTDVFGNVVGPVTTDANGAYTFDNLPVLPAGQSYTVTIDPVASASALEPYIPTTPGDGTNPLDSSTGSASSGDLTENGDRDDTLDFGFVQPSVSVGDYVWVDTDRDGRQDAGEPGIPGVVLVLTGTDGNEVTDVFGNPVGPVTTDANGLYTFDNLPVLAEGESYTVSIDQVASAPALAPYVPTVAGVGNDVAVDSSTWTAMSGALTQDGDRDPTLDFGFVQPRVSVGDYVWVDENRDGLQTPGEPGIPGVVLVLTGPDGNAVTDVFGNPVGPVTTDGAGAYTFDNLPVLPAGQSYTVTIDQVASAPALAPYVPTTAGDGSSPLDSSTWTASSGDLTQDGDRDPTLDFGFVLPTTPTTPPTTPPLPTNSTMVPLPTNSTTSPQPTNSTTWTTWTTGGVGGTGGGVVRPRPPLAVTGVPADQLLVVGGLILLLGAGIVVAGRRPKKQAH